MIDRLRTHFNPGTWWMVASAASFAVMAASAKILTEIPSLEKVFIRSLISVGLTAWAIRRAGVDLKPVNPGKLTLRAGFGFLGLWFYFEAIDRIPLGTAVTVQNTTPLFAALVGVLVLGESIRKIQVASLFIGLAGIGLIKGFSPDVSWVGLGFGLGTAVFSALAYSMVRVLTRTEHPLIIVMAFPLLSLPLAAGLGFQSFVWPSPPEWGWLLLLGAATQSGQICITHGLRHHTASRATQIGFVGVLFAMLLSIPIENTWPTLSQFTGAGIVFLSLTLGRKSRSET
ncbi:MAG: DMT family transporter [Planctomycetes bacterium]|nr:DMT family transporter [Planctomycetota bacterium]